MTAARIKRIAEEIAVARCKATLSADARAVARRALEEARDIASVLDDEAANTNAVDELAQKRAAQGLAQAGYVARKR